MGTRQLGARVKVLVLGAGGIIGQHMMLSRPEGIEAIYFRRHADPLCAGLDLTDSAAREAALAAHSPDVVVNLAGESSPDVVEQHPEAYRAINVAVPSALAIWCDAHEAHYLHVSSQIVLDPVNEYGLQKADADHLVMQHERWTIAQPTFVLGVRPLPCVGRANPVEQILAGQRRQVNDRFFSPSLARDVAQQLWKLAAGAPQRQVIRLGVPARVSRFDIAQMLTEQVTPVAHDDVGLAALGGVLAPRPRDTSFAPATSRYSQDLGPGLEECLLDWRSREQIDIRQRAREIALFLGEGENDCLKALCCGFQALHHRVAQDFRRFNPQTDEQLLEWYRLTEAYIWELSAYHCDAGFNYVGMCRGVTERLRACGVKRVLCLGDGIGDLTLALWRAGMEPVYHDLAGSRTAEFAQFRFWVYTGLEAMPSVLTRGWAPEIGGGYDAVVSLDFLEHVTDVPAWTAAIHAALVPGGLFMAQNAFAAGSGPKGSIPCHLARNDHYERDWDPLMAQIGMIQESSNWYRKAA